MTAHRTTRRHDERGYVMVALLVALSVMSIMMSVALPAWNTRARREKETELIFRGMQYARAIAAYQRKFGNAYPPNVDALVTEKMLRKKYLDPVTNDAFEVVGPGSAIEGSSTPTALQGRTGGAGTQGRTGGTTSSISTSTSFTAGSLGRSTGTGSTAQTGGRATSTGARGGTNTAPGPITGGATAGIFGVRSKSKDKSLRVYNGAEHYNEWLFTGAQATSIVSSPNGGAAGAGSGRGQAGGRGGTGNTTGGRGQQPAGRGRDGGAGTRGAGTGNRGGTTPAGGRTGGGFSGFSLGNSR